MPIMKTDCVTWANDDDTNYIDDDDNNGHTTKNSVIDNCAHPHATSANETVSTANCHTAQSRVSPIATITLINSHALQSQQSPP